MNNEGEEWKDKDDQDPDDAFDVFAALMGGNAIPQGTAFDRDKLVEKIARKFNIDKDELNILYPDDEALLEYYNNVLLKSKELIAEEITADMPEDDYKLTERNKGDLEVLKDDEQRIAEREQKRAARQAAFKAAQEAIEKAKNDPDMQPPDETDFDVPVKPAPKAKNRKIKTPPPPVPVAVPPVAEAVAEQEHNKLQESLPEELRVPWKEIKAMMDELRTGDENKNSKQTDSD